MKKSLFAFLLASMASFAQNGRIHLETEITNPNSDSIVIHNKEFKTTLRGKGGIFSADIEAPRGFYQYFDGREFATLYLNSGYDLKLKADGKHLNESLSFSGTGSAENNYLVQKKKNDQKIKQSFGGKLPTDAALQHILDQRMTEAQIALSGKNFEAEFPALMLAEYETENQRIKADLASVRVKEGGLSALRNTKAPEFQFENYKGGKTKLSDLKGKILYIDIWATWCGPCRSEIPHLKKLEETFQGKDVAFVSISIDELKNQEKWKKFVSDNKLKGTQLLADAAWKSQWIQHFKIEGIPRFILIGKDGNILDPDAPRPSSGETAKLISDLL